ncbi:hypothetical protein MBLNU230_g4383t1 [Neophaeotheca triangularis]
MSFGGFGSSNTGGGFGGFGSNNNNTNTTGGFGSNANASTGGSVFGGNTGAAAGGFGGTGGNSPFGAANKPAFGAPAATSGGGMFGGNTSTSGGFGGGGFGGSTSNTGGGFGGSSSGGLFGQQASKPASTGFGGNAGGGIFGGGASTGGGFGNTGTAGTTGTGTFGGGASTGFGQSATNTTSTGGGFGGFGQANAASTPGNNNSGTGGTPFSAFVEKDGATSQNSHYQSITFQQPYQNKSFEELRVEDYMQGRKNGNTNGQAGSFGTSTGFGGFGAGNTATGTSSTTGGGLFGSNASTANNNTTTGTGFGGFGGSQQNNTSSFGGFGANKPATGGFGQPASSATTTGGFGQTASSGGGLFGGNNNNSNTAGGFGAGTTTGTTGGGLFGSNNQQQNKPAFGGFGSTPSNTTTGFGQTGNNNAGGGLFGSGANTTNSTSTGFGGFGGANANQQQQNSNPFGAPSTNTGFGASQNKPATGGGLFGGASNNTGGAFGQNQQQQQASTPFGGGANSNTGGSSLFGQSQNKPAGGGLFGSATGQTNTGGGSLFGGLNQNQNQNTNTNSTFGGGAAGSGSLFGAKPAAGNTGGLFGNSGSANTGGGLFGQSQNQNQQNNNSNSLFGGMGSNQQGQQGNGTSLFGQSNNNAQQQQQQSQAQPSGQLHTSLTAAPYGNEQLFSSLASPSPPIGPLATPLSGARPTPRKGPSLLASTRLNSPAHTPRGSSGSLGRSAGYGFSYSNYGTPSSVYSNSLTPGASSLLRQSGSFGRSSGLLSKSYSTSNLRGDVSQSEGNSLLRSSAFSPSGTGSGSYGRNSVRKLHIDRSLRSDLFGPPPGREEGERRQSKSVSFDNAVLSGSANGSATPNNNSSISTALVRTEESEDRTPQGSKSQSANQASQGEQTNVNGASGLSTVPEDGEPARSSPATAPRTHASKPRESPPGDYYMDPPLRQLQNMSRAQLQKVNRFRVGRENAGFIDFGPCDLTSVDLDKVLGDIVQIEARNATVYPDKKSTPPMGQGLNVPSLITLEQTWPKKGRKGRNGEVIQTPEERLIDNLKKIDGTAFMDWNRDTGVWRFRVQHFTTYGLDDDDDEDEFGESRIETEQSSSVLTDAPPTTDQQDDYTLASVDSSNVDEDTFQFKLEKRSQRSQQGYMPPGGFTGGDVSYEFDDKIMEEAPTPAGLNDESMADSILSAGGPVQAPSPGTLQKFHSSQMEQEPVGEQIEEPEEAVMSGAYSAPLEPKFPRSILKPTTAAFVSPQKAATETWEEKLQQTLSPRKRDRRALKDMQQPMRHPAEDDEVNLMAFGQSTFGQSALGQSYLAQKSAKKAPAEANTGPAFETTIDIMNSLWGQRTGKSNARQDGFEIPQPKKQRFTDADGSTPMDAEFRDSFKSKFMADGTLVYAGNAPPGDGMETAKAPVVGERRDVRFARFSIPQDGDSNMTLIAQQDCTVLEKAHTGEIPHALNTTEFTFKDFQQSVPDGLALWAERDIWQLCSILFDAPEVAFPGWANDLPHDLVHLYESKARMDTFNSFWAKLCPNESQLRSARTEEEKALLHLAIGDIVKACEVLVAAKDFKLATIVAQLPGDPQSQEYMSKQIEAWKQRGDWSEMSDSMRALYSITAGSFCTVAGTGGSTENRSSEFCIAERFGLSWKQSLALRVHYGGFASLEKAIDAYVQDLETQKEKLKPTAGDGEGSTAREDPLFGLLRLATRGTDADCLTVLEPTLAPGSSTSTRLPWQLANLLIAADLISLPADKMDCLTNTYAAELELQTSLVNAAWVLLHLHESIDRQHAIKGLLERKAGSIPDTGDTAQPGTVEQLVEQGKIPSDMIWKAKALHAQAVLKDPALQASYLLQANDADAAHDILVGRVGPSVVVERNYDALQLLLQDFEHAPSIDRAKWDAGGQVFADFARLMTMNGGQKEAERGGLVRRLQRGLAGMEQMQERAPKGAIGLEARVALVEMHTSVKKIAKELGEKTSAPAQTKARLSSAQDLLAKYTMAMAA